MNSFYLSQNNFSWSVHLSEHTNVCFGSWNESVVLKAYHCNFCMLTEQSVEIVPSGLFIENVQKYAPADCTS